MWVIVVKQRKTHMKSIIQMLLKQRKTHMKSIIQMLLAIFVVYIAFCHDVYSLVIYVMTGCHIDSHDSVDSNQILLAYF